MRMNDKSNVVCIVGNANIDVLMKSIDVMPDWGTETIVDSYDERLGGCEANSAVVLASLGQETHIVATVGNNWHGEDLRNTLRDAGVNIHEDVFLSKGIDGTELLIDRNFVILIV